MKHVEQPWILSAKQNLLVCDTLKEAFDFLKGLKNRGITRASFIGTGMSVRLSDNGFWIWSEDKK